MYTWWPWKSRQKWKLNPKSNFTHSWNFIWWFAGFKLAIYLKSVRFDLHLEKEKFMHPMSEFMFLKIEVKPRKFMENSNSISSTNPLENFSSSALQPQSYRYWLCMYLYVVYNIFRMYACGKNLCVLRGHLFVAVFYTQHKCMYYTNQGQTDEIELCGVYFPFSLSASADLL